MKGYGAERGCRTGGRVRRFVGWYDGPYLDDQRIQIWYWIVNRASGVTWQRGFL